MARRSHAKTRSGCATCKARRIKCKEERPECRNCIKHGVTCPGYTEIQRNSTRSRKARGDSNALSHLERSGENLNNASTAYTQPLEVIESMSQPQPSKKPSDIIELVCVTDVRRKPPDDDAKSDWPVPWTRAARGSPDSMASRRSWTTGWPTQENLSYGDPYNCGNSLSNKSEMHNQLDALLLNCFDKAVNLVPSLTFSIEADVWDNIHKLTGQWKSIYQSILSFASTYMHFITNDSCYSEASIIYRGSALQALQHDMRASREGIDAAIAASILLADQAAFEGDWRASILHHRGLANLCMHHATTSKASIFARTRSFDPGRRLVQRRRVNIEAIQSTPDGHGCYTSLQRLKHYLMSQHYRPDMNSQEFLGTAINSTSVAYRDVQYMSGGLGHLLAIACDVHKTHADLCADGKESEPRALLQSMILQGQEESNAWLIDLPQGVLSEAFENDLTALVLLSYKFSIDLLLHRCTLLARGTNLLPPPAAIMGVEYIRFAFSTVSCGPGDKYTNEEHRLLLDCMNWPLWVLSWAQQFTAKERIQTVAHDSGLTLSLDSSSRTDTRVKPT